MSATCETCPFFNPGDPTDPKRMANGGGAFGDCRRSPPAMLPAPSSGPMYGTLALGRWPMVHPTAWCGEHPERRQR